MGVAFFALTSCGGGGSEGSVQDDTDDTIAGFNLVWSEEFEGNSLDASKWNIETGYGPINAGWGNDEGPDLAARGTWSALHLTVAYMVLFAVLYVTIPEVFLLPFGAKADPTEFIPLRDMAVIMLRFVAIYSLVDGISLTVTDGVSGVNDRGHG